jgi:hypothetical protein
MLYRIVKPFLDKETHVLYKQDEIVEFTKKRAKEILKVDKLIEEVKEEK